MDTDHQERAVTSEAPIHVKPVPWPLRVCWITLGLLSTGVGAIGIVVPGLPSTVFFVAAAWCFARSSPRLEEWLLNLPAVGPLVRDFRDGLGMPRRTKKVVLVMIAVACSVSAWVVNYWWVAFSILGVGLIGMAWVWWKVPTREIELARRGLPPRP